MRWEETVQLYYSTNQDHQISIQTQFLLRMLHLPTMFRISYQGPCITVRFQESCLTRLLFTNTSEYFKNQASNCKVKHDKKNHPIMTKNQFNLLVLLEKNIYLRPLYTCLESTSTNKKRQEKLLTQHHFFLIQALHNQATQISKELHLNTKTNWSEQSLQRG